MFEGFERRRVDAPGASINLVVGGSGPPLLLLHGYPQTHAMWHRVAPALAERHTVVAADLRGYGDSDKPAGGPGHANYAKRAMAADQAAVMDALGFARFSLAGHDRGARCAHRLALDHGRRVDKVAFLDIVPTFDVWERSDRRHAWTSFHWYFLSQDADLPEVMIGADPDFWLTRMLEKWSADMDAFAPEAMAEYLRCFRDPAAIHATCEDYRAGYTIDVDHDAADRDRRIECPVLALWGERAGSARNQSVLEIWRGRARDVRGRPLACGHFLAEERPEETVRELLAFFSA
ncbi:MAG: alpha/beta hydrolase [Alphaproteobacteria bacterium]|nr:alpha/beta hydrolase [Alphaproteobacteria bacterium]